MSKNVFIIEEHLCKAFGTWSRGKNSRPKNPRGFQRVKTYFNKKKKDKQQKTKTKNMRGFRNFEGDGGCRTSGILGSVSELND